MPYIIVALGVLLYFGMGRDTKRYAAEVGYYRGTEIAWDIWGDFKTLDDCRTQAMAQYNVYYANNKRAYIWSCLLKNDSAGYASRHR